MEERQGARAMSAAKHLVHFVRCNWLERYRITVAAQPALAAEPKARARKHSSPFHSA
jgi:hypothetical protein